MMKGIARIITAPRPNALLNEHGNMLRIASNDRNNAEVYCAERLALLANETGSLYSRPPITVLGQRGG